MDTLNRRPVALMDMLQLKYGTPYTMYGIAGRWLEAWREWPFVIIICITVLYNILDAQP